jgi:hypothetical protein
MKTLKNAAGTRILLVTLAALAGVTLSACSSEKNAPATAGIEGLSQPYTYTVGDDIASRMSGFFRVVAGLEASTQVYYDHKSGHIVADVVGSATDVDGAKRELESFLVAVRGYIAAYAKSQHGITLTAKDVTLIYHNDGGEGAPYEVVRWEDGVYKPAPLPQGGGEPKD